MRRTLLMTAVFALAWAALIAGVVLAEAAWFAQPGVERGNIRSIEEHLTRKLREAAADRKLGAAALVLIHRGRIVAEHGFGIADATTNAPVSPDRSLFQVASVSKAVTAWGVMKLVQDGGVGLDEPVMRHLKRWRFPGSDAYRDRVTVRHLLSHTAGLDDGLGYGGFLPGQRVQTLEESLTSAEDSTVGRPRPVQVVREPGTALSYSGGGYTVLQLLLEEVTGRPFAAFMKETVLRPLGMTAASFDWSELAAQDLVTPYDSNVVPKPRRRHAALAAVALYATPRDLAQFALAFAGNPVLSHDTLRQTLQPQPGTSGTWALGHTLFVATGAGSHIVGHDGGSPPAWGAMVRVNPATGNAMIVTVSGGAGAINDLGHDWLYWETGQVTPEGRRQLIYRRIAPASAAFVLGLLVFMLARVHPYARASRESRSSAACP